jgi:hypothetical protein
MATIRRRSTLLGLAASAVLAALSIAPVLADEPTESELRQAENLAAALGVTV